MSEIGAGEEKWDVSRYGVGLPVLIAAIILTASVIFGLRSMVQAEVEQQIRPLAVTMDEVKTELRELRKGVQDLREDLALQKGKLE